MCFCTPEKRQPVCEYCANPTESSIGAQIKHSREKMNIPYAYNYEEVISDLFEIVKKLNDKIETLEAKQ
jgi:predicted amidophosphoribosyltransferase